MSKIGFIYGAPFHNDYLNPLFTELLARGHNCQAYRIRDQHLEYANDCDLYIAPDSHYHQMLPCDKPILQTFHGLFGGGGYFRARGNRKAAAFLSSGPALTAFLKETFPHKLIIESGCVKLDGINRGKIPPRRMIYASNWQDKYRTYPEMISSLHQLQDNGWSVRVTLHQWLIDRLEAGASEKLGVNLVAYAEEHFDFLTGNIQPIELATCRFVLGGFTSVITEAFVLGTPVIILTKHGDNFDEWPFWKRMLQICPTVNTGDEGQLMNMVGGLRLQTGPEFEELRRQIVYPLDGKACTRACAGIEGGLL